MIFRENIYIICMLYIACFTHIACTCGCIDFSYRCFVFSRNANKSNVVLYLEKGKLRNETVEKHMVPKPILKPKSAIVTLQKASSAT